MALDLLARQIVWDADEGVGVEAAYLVARLCEEAGVCQDPEPLEHNPLTKLEAATFDVEEGLVVVCGHTGKKYRLRVTAEELPECSSRKRTGRGRAGRRGDS